MTDLIPCANGCTKRHGDEWHPVHTEPPSQLCGHCETRLTGWLETIPDNYALLPTFIEHGTTDRNPESKATKGVNAAAPMRLDIIDLLDERRGRKWLGTEATEDRRGVLGTLWAHIDRLAEERPLSTIPEPTVVTACKLLIRHRLWLTEQTWITDLYEDIRALHRDTSDAIGNYRQKPVATCTIVTDTGDCGGNIYATLNGAHCTRCREEWGPDQLRLLGLTLDQAG